MYQYTGVQPGKQEIIYVREVEDMWDWRRAELNYAFPRTVPIMVGYLFLGAAYGILMNVNGYGIGWTAAISIFVYAGSLQYLGVTMLAAAVHPVTALVMSLMLNARHLFYGISMLGKYGGLKRFRAYLIFSLTDETFSVVCSEQIPSELEREWVYFWISFLNQCYWVGGSVLGALSSYIWKGCLYFAVHGSDFRCFGLFLSEKGKAQDRADKGREGGRGMSQIPVRALLIVSAMVVGTLITRFLPFFAFPAGKKTPAFVDYLGKTLPFATMGLLVVYCLKGLHLTAAPYGLPEILSVGLIAVLHWRKGNSLLSIGIGTVFYMFLVQAVFR